MVSILLLCIFSSVSVVLGEDIALGSSFGIGIVNGLVFSFGGNRYGELGLGFFGDYSFSNEIHIIDQFSDGTIEAVSAGTYHAAAVDSLGELYVWGRNSNGQLGLGDTDNRNSPTHIVISGKPGKVESVGCSAFNTFIIADGALFGVGNTAYDQLGDHGNVNVTSPVAISVGIDKVVVKVAAADTHVCAITSDQELFCWGNGGYGRLGNGDFLHRDVPTRVSEVTGLSNLYIDVALGGWHTCALDTGFNVLCMGEGSNGKLGRSVGTASFVRVPTLAFQSWNDEGDTIAVYRISANGGFTCAYNDARAWCFGSVTSRWLPQDESQLNDLQYAQHPLPLRQETIGIATLALGSQRTCLKDDEGAIRCYGKDQMGRNGSYDVLDFSQVDGSGVDDPAPTAALTTTTVTSFYAKDSSTVTFPRPMSLDLLTTSSTDSAKSTSYPLSLNLEVTKTESPKEVVNSRRDDDGDSENGVVAETELPSDNEDPTLYIIIGASAAALCCFLMVLILLFRVAQRRKAKRRAVRGNNAKANTNVALVPASRSSRSKSGSKRASVSMPRRNANVAMNQQPSPYAQVQLAPSNGHHYQNISVYAPRPNQYDPIVLATENGNCQYEYANLSMAKSNQYDSMPHPAPVDQYATGDVVDMNPRALAF